MAEYNWFYGPDSDLCFSVWKQQQGAGEAAGKGKNNMSDKIFVIFDLFLKYYLSVLSVIQNTLCLSVTDMSTKFSRCHWESLKVPINK